MVRIIVELAKTVEIHLTMALNNSTCLTLVDYQLVELILVLTQLPLINRCNIHLTKEVTNFQLKMEMEVVRHLFSKRGSKPSQPLT